MSTIWEWLDNISVCWYAATIAFILAITWLAYKIHRAPAMEEEELVHHQRSTELPADVIAYQRQKDQLLTEIEHLIHELEQLHQTGQKGNASRITDRLEKKLRQLSGLKAAKTCKQLSTERRGDIP
ncbi:MAG: hypothetical protein ABFC84_17685 [Veillonellales bacterium]